MTAKFEGTRIYGQSDDLIEFDGQVHGEVSCYGTDDREKGVLLVCSDGTLLEVKYGKAELGIWGITLLAKGSCFQQLVPCMDEEEKIHSDLAVFGPGLTWVYAAKEWERVK